MRNASTMSLTPRITVNALVPAVTQVLARYESLQLLCRNLSGIQPGPARIYESVRARR
jgi:hypothetical protein